MPQNISTNPASKLQLTFLRLSKDKKSVSFVVESDMQNRTVRREESYFSGQSDSEKKLF